MPAISDDRGSQINPHFLYNSLNSIRWMATIQNAPGIAEMTTSLAHLLKSASKGQQTLIPLAKELSLLGDYFVIQSYRYGGAINLTEDVPPELGPTLLELTEQTLLEALRKAQERIDDLSRSRGTSRRPPAERFGMQPFYDRFFIRLINNLFESEEQMRAQQKELGVDFSFEAYAVCYCELPDLTTQSMSQERLMNLYSSTTQLVYPERAPGGVYLRIRPGGKEGGGEAGGL